jgi:all-trans-retinol 13,14-reductase
MHSELKHNIYRLHCHDSGAIRHLMFFQMRRSARKDMNILSMLEMSRFDEWAQWEHTVTGSRGKDYVEKKQAKAEALIQQAVSIFGPLHGVRIIDSYSPLTMRDWVSAPRGSTYGVLRSADQMLQASSLNRTPVKGLYMAGQSVQSPGILGTIIGSLMTVSLIVGPERFRREVTVGV